MADSEKPNEGSAKIAAFRKAVHSAFGRNLEKATPANVREFMERRQDEIFHGEIRGRIELNEPKTTYEEILKDFFASVLEKPSDEALIMLWTIAFELSFSALELHLSEQLQTLFGESDDFME